MPIAVREAKSEDLTDVLELYKQPDMDDGRVLPVEQAEAVYDKGRNPFGKRRYFICKN